MILFTFKTVNGITLGPSVTVHFEAWLRNPALGEKDESPIVSLG
jgi:hypothetical protein